MRGTPWGDPDRVYKAKLVFISLVLITVGHGIILQRHEGADTRYLTIRGDTHAYVSMTQGYDAPTPYKYRILVPLLARAFPFSPTESLRLISYGSLFVFYIVVLLGCRRLDIGLSSAVVGVLIVFASAWHLEMYHNPFTIDAFSLMIVSVMIVSLLYDNFLLFCIAAVLGILTRETVIFLVPLWCTKREWSKAGSLLVGTVGIVLLVRYLIPADKSGIDQVISALDTAGVIQSPISYLKSVALSWSYGWLLALLGILLLSSQGFMTLLVAFTLLLMGALLSSLIATDTGRMFSFLAPVVVMVSARLYQVANEVKAGRLIIWTGLCVLIAVQLFTSMPNVLFGEESRVFTSWPRNVTVATKATFLIGVVLALCIAYVLRGRLLTGFREKLARITGTRAGNSVLEIR